MNIFIDLDYTTGLVATKNGLLIPFGIGDAISRDRPENLPGLRATLGASTLTAFPAIFATVKMEDYRNDNKRNTSNNNNNSSSNKKKRRNNTRQRYC